MRLTEERVDFVRRQPLTPGFDGARLVWTTPKCLA